MSTLYRFILLCLLCACAWQLSAMEIPNGNMEADLSAWRAENGASIQRDTDQKSEGSSSFRLDAQADAEGKAVLTVQADGPATFDLRGNIKADGSNISGALGVLAFSKSGKPVGGWQHVANVHAHDWKAFSKSVTLPADTGKFMIILTAKGGGTVWLDGLTGGTEAGQSGNHNPVSLPAEDISRFQGPVPEITNIGAISPERLCIELREFKWVPGELIPYQKQDGDIIENTKVRKDGTVLSRTLKRNGQKIGQIVGPDNNLHLQTKGDSATGKPLDRNKALDPNTWTLTDKSGMTLKPVSVALKQKPIGGPGDQMRDNWYMLTFKEALKQGQTYTLDLGQHQMTTSFTFDPRAMRSEAVHCSHIGHRPDDGAKLGFLSYWSGTGGPVTYKEGLTFELLNDADGKTVFSGKTVLRMSKDKTSYGTHAKGRSYTMADVFICDFSAFNKPGTYRLYVDGVGCSHPFPINREAWTTAAKNSLRGFFHQRAGQEWKKPWADWEQPRAFHPDNGEDYWELSKSQLDIHISEGMRHENAMDDGLFDKWKTGKKVANAWGGYYDAGDFDRHTGHLICSRNMLELLELFPDYYKTVKLPIPESDNNLPDLLDEALWAIDLYKRMQREDGAIYGGIETNGHPKPGEPAWLDSLTRYVFAPDAQSCWRYAASAARAAYVFDKLNKSTERDDYLQSALRAMEWAEQDYTTRKDFYHSSNNWWRIKDSRNLAAVALYRMNNDQRWNKVFEETCIFKDSPGVSVWKTGMQEEAAFIYARMADEKTNLEIKKYAIAGIKETAEKQIVYSDGIAYMWTGPKGDPGFPLILSINAAPQGLSLCRAWYLSKEATYLDYAIKSSLYSVGANPQNMTFTTRLGYKSPEFPLQCTTMTVHQEKPYSGYTVYGLAASYPAPDWVTKWFVNDKSTAPIDMNSWPVAESYWDVKSWPAMNENTVQQSMAPAVYVWGFLAGRE